MSPWLLRRFIFVVVLFSVAITIAVFLIIVPPVNFMSVAYLGMLMVMIQLYVMWVGVKEENFRQSKRKDGLA